MNLEAHVVPLEVEREALLKILEREERHIKALAAVDLQSKREQSYEQVLTRLWQYDSGEEWDKEFKAFKRKMSGG